MMEPLSPLLGPFQSRSQNGPYQEGAALQGPFQSRSQNGPFQVRSSFQEGVVLLRPLLFFVDPVVHPRFPIPFFRPSKISEGFSISRLFGMNRSFLLRWAEAGEEEELNMLTPIERQKIFSCQL